MEVYMISEKEIRKEIKYMLDQEKEILKEMLASIEEYGDYNEAYVDKLKEFHAQRIALKWVLDEEEE
jgi:hypothetical protein